MKTWIVFIAVASANYVAANLHCFHCTNITDGFVCNTVTECHSGQDCFIDRHGGGNDTRFSLGCINSQQCPAVHPFEIVGRSVSSDCKKCCHETGCNKKYCEVLVTSEPLTTVGTCTDAPGENCTRMDMLFSICSDPHKAQHVCRKHCGLCDMVDGGWAIWNAWSPCSTSCDLGLETRSRQCNNPSPRHGGYPCPGQSTQHRSCYTLECPTHGGWASWASWESCSASCGNGIRKRHRTCSNPVPSANGHYCIGDGVDFALCEGDFCGNHTVFVTTPPTVSVCQDTLPSCATFAATFGVCKNRTMARQTCQKFCNLCGIVDGRWSDWELWTSCSVSCDNGLTTRTRSCTNPAPLNGGNICIGNTTESKSCKIRECPVHGAWGSWASWTSCSASCGPGMTHRTRACDSPRPSLLGNNCFGDSSEYGLCTVKPCPVNGNWSGWSFWSSCSVTCGSGLKSRQRYCSNPAPSNGGSACTGSSTEQVACNVMSCPVNGQWSSWTSWSTCSSLFPCEAGLSTRHRNCSNPAPSSGGQWCIGDATVERLCHQVHCFDRHAFQVLRSKNVTYKGYDFLALEVRVPTDGLSRGSNWCYDYQYLCGEFNRRPTGCGGSYTSYSSTVSCRDKYNSDMNNGDVLGCIPSGGVAAVANLVFPNLSPPAQGNVNAFGFQRCDSNFCSKTLQGSDTALTYMRGFWQSNMTTMYTVCR